MNQLSARVGILLALTAFLAPMGLLDGRAHADSIVVPSALEAVEGNSQSNAFLSDGQLWSLREQQVFAASEFSGIGTITEIAFRTDGAWQGGAVSGTLYNVRVSLSTTSMLPDGLDSLFASNIGSDEVVVFSGNLSLAIANVPGPGGLYGFDAVISLSSPFIYDPSMGNLLLDYQRDDSTFNYWNAGPSGFAFDAVRDATDSVSRAIGYRYGNSASLIDTTGYVTRFTIVPVAVPEVPEPATVVSIGTGLLLIAVRRLRSHRKA